jgi:glycosyltransferase involved in cell wall biosynthesis
MLSHDVLVIQKVFSRWHLQILAVASRLSKTTVLDLDDWPSSSNHPRTLQNVASMMASSTAVAAGSRNLLEYALQHQPNSHLIPSCIRLQSYQPSRKPRGHDGLCLGWIGNGAHYQRDLIDILVPVMSGLAGERPLRFILVGGCGVARLQEAFRGIEGLELRILDEIDWSSETAAAEIISEFDVGLYPLNDNTVNRNKCAFKALEYMAMGVPVVASPVGANADVVSDGVDGYLPTSVRGWVESLKTLIDEPRRLQMGNAGRQKVVRRYPTSRAASDLARIILGSDNDVPSGLVGDVTGIESNRSLTERDGSEGPFHGQ